MKHLAFSAARAVNAAYFVVSSLYCVLSYSSFAYAQFIRPQLIGWLPDAVAVHHQLFWITVVVTLPTLLPAIRRGTTGRRLVAASYLGANVLLGVWLTANPVLALAGPNPDTLLLAIMWLVPPFMLAVVDHVTAGTPALGRVDHSRLFAGIATAAVVTWLSYLLLVPWYVPRTVGVELPWASLVVAAAISFATHALAFALIYLIATAALSLAATARAVLVEYWVVASLLVIALAFILQRVVAAALSFRAEESWVLSVWLSVVLVAIWSGVAWQSRRGHDAIEHWFSPIAPNVVVAAIGLVSVPLVALGLRGAVAHFDWNFLLQKLGVTLVWALTIGWATTLLRQAFTRLGTLSRRTCDVIAIAAVVAGLGAAPIVARAAAAAGEAALEPEFVLDRYASLDASYQLLRSLIRTNAGADADFYSFLRAHSTLGQVSANPVDVTLAPAFQPNAAPPHVFLFIIDSLRRDYLSPYNPAVTFTPATDAFARESVVFDRAFTRYGATGLSVPALWTGGMLLHKQYVEPFAPMNSLEKLLDGVGYRRLMSDDHLVVSLFRPSPLTTLLDADIDEMDHTVCGTVRELQARLDATSRDPRPIFAMTRPLQLHVARLARDTAPPAADYPGFVPGYAAQVAALDRCFGGFIEYLKARRLYDDSVVILTSDHGESLGEEGRWGHAYTLHPEVVRIPLIVHLPSRLAARLTTDPSRVALSTDVTPTLYALAGQAPRHLGVLYGSPLFTPIDQPVPARRRESFLLASSYGPVYAMLRHNGRSLYIANAIEGRDVAYQMRADGRMDRLTLTDVMRTVNRSIMREHIGQIAADYRFFPPP
jgi:glucan phosphoethanolaminetransferase (alkaline phosphatase superfamily)